MAELLVALLFISIGLFGYIALQIRLIDSNEKLVAKQTALQDAEVQLSQSVAAYRREESHGFPPLSPTIAKTTWSDRNGQHTYRVDTLTSPVRVGW
jgi:Tfp pilus assembly protein PilV